MATTLELERLVTVFTGDASSLLRTLNDIGGKFKSTQNLGLSFEKSLSTNFRTLGVGILSVIGPVTALSSAISGMAVSIAAELERAEVAFRLIVNNADEATKAIEGLKGFAANSPFKYEDLLQTATALAGIGTETDKIVPTLQRFGDMAAGLNIPLSRLVRTYDNLITQGRVYAQDVRNLARMGIPVYLELAKVLQMVPRSTKHLLPEVAADVRKLISEGAIGGDLMEKVFHNLTSPEGSVFHGQIAKQADTVIGIFNRMRTQVEFTLRDIGDMLTDGLNLKGLLQQGEELAKSFNFWLKNMDSSTKEVILTVVALTAAFTVLGVAIYAAGIVLNIMTGGAAIWIGLITTAIAVGTMWTIQTGGLAEAWYRVKLAVSDFWNFIRPIIPAIATLLVALNPPLFGWYVALGLVIVYWKDVRQAIVEFWAWAQPILQATWSLIKTIGFAVRDGLVKWIEIAGAALAELGQKAWKALGGDQINWKEVQDGARDLMIFMEYAFSNINASAQLAWSSIKFGGIVMADELLKNLLTVPVLLIAGFVVMARAIGMLFEAMFVAILKAAEIAITSIWDAIKNLKFDDIVNLTDSITKAIKTATVQALVTVVKEVDETFKEIERRTGKITINKLALGEVQIPVGINVEGLQKERAAAFKEVKEANRQVGEEFEEFKKKKLVQFQIEDTQDAMRKGFQQLYKGLPKEEGEKAGGEYLTGFAEEFKHKAGHMIDFTAIVNSAQAKKDIKEYLDALPTPEFLDRTRITQNTNVAVSSVPPNTAELEMVKLLIQIALNTSQVALKEPVMVPPTADLNR